MFLPCKNYNLNHHIPSSNPQTIKTIQIKASNLNIIPCHPASSVFFQYLFILAFLSHTISSMVPCTVISTWPSTTSVPTQGDLFNANAHSRPLFLLCPQFDWYAIKINIPLQGNNLLNSDDPRHSQAIARLHTRLKRAYKTPLLSFTSTAKSNSHSIDLKNMRCSNANQCGCDCTLLTNK